MSKKSIEHRMANTEAQVEAPKAQGQAEHSPAHVPFPIKLVAHDEQVLSILELQQGEHLVERK